MVRTLKTAWPGRWGRGRSDRFSTSTSLSRHRGSSQRLRVLLDSQSRQTIRGPMIVLSQWSQLTSLYRPRLDVQNSQ